MDPLSDVLSLLRPKTAISAGLDAGGEWAIRFPAHEGIKFNTVIKGACWVSVDGEAEPLRIEAGDCFLLTRGRPFLFATDRAPPAIDSATIYDKAADGIATCNGGGDFFLIGGRFAFEGDHAGLLFGALPAIVHVRDASNQAAVLRWALEQLALELKHGSPGGTLMADHLAQIMLLQVLRLWLASGKHSGWLGALADQRLTRALGAMHAEPERRWTLVEFADLASMSRTTFAERFRDVVGQTPLDYLAGWRMRLAADRLHRSGDSVAAIGFSVGYESEAAFSTAFRRVMGRTPMQHRRMAVA
ncbi:AraC family transcriptional regulator [Rhizobium sp. NZLR1b]|uniref:AraC family transcriptional regulator n=1 Tax=unclassified Rhizobium TaxID=2613769 RepID=UPI001C83E20E|nr:MULTISPECIES: AraC family transcriptional regulator [unclassified Rhizobium]MBX5173364.1 AraC family transcriptional regulator [Rhizobium sp. NZLR1b]MBX5192569.1 AraC family transcriptional regulator [Rhizobium sp. NZLR3b]